jgi:hypothetical protein
MVNQIQPEDPLIPHPLPPQDFKTRELSTVSSQGTWYRLNAVEFSSSLYFDHTGKGRFDSPAQGYGILYVGADIYASWIECYGRTHGATGVSELGLRQRDLYAIDSNRPLVFADLTGRRCAIIFWCLYCCQTMGTGYLRSSSTGGWGEISFASR